MLFSSMIFLWIFLPSVLLLYCIAPAKCKNIVLLLASLLFYGWGEPKYLLLLILSVTINYFFGRLLENHSHRAVLISCILINLGILGYFKYYNFVIQTLNALCRREVLSVREIALPLGISFFTFQILSYVIDVYRGDCQVQKNYFKLLLYVSFFPQLIAGPIVKYRDIENQIDHRRHTAQGIGNGIKRFIYGLGKKVLLSNVFAYYADLIIDHELYREGAVIAWIGAVLYTLQIYYDFSGYSDMAIGLGKMFGFEFRENFRYPYCSESIREFWRRWHISLSTWFREYVYIPLGGNRKGKYRTYLNLMLVFLLTGLWHGAGFNFILWGVYYGVILVAERMFLGKLLDWNRFKLLNRIYTMLAVIVGWVLFRNDLPNARVYVYCMLHLSLGSYGLSNVVSFKMVLFTAIGLVLCGDGQRLLGTLRKNRTVDRAAAALEIPCLFGILFLCIVMLVSDMYNPFIYFRF